MTRRIEITVSEGTWDRLNSARGHEPRASFVKRALESALGAGVPLSRVENLRETDRGEIVAADPAKPVSFRAPVPSVRRGSSDALARQARLNKEKGL